MLSLGKAYETALLSGGFFHAKAKEAGKARSKKTAFKPPKILCALASPSRLCVKPCLKEPWF
jgi:hypothetical protein